MKTIKTVLGEIKPDELGFTDMHDHVWKQGGMEVLEDKDFGIESIEKSNDELKRFHAAGGNSLVDMQPIGVGRSIEKLCEIAKDTNVNLIAITGFHRGALYDKAHFVFKYSEDEIYEIVRSEVEKGIEINDFCGPFTKHSGIKPGLVKCGTGYYKINDIEKKLMRVVARVSKDTGIPIGTHTHQGTMGYEQACYLIEHGADPEKIMIGHLDRNADLEMHKKVLKLGVYVQYDCFARVKYHPVCDTMDLIKKLSKLGYSNRMMVGGDWGRSSYLKAYGGSPGLEFVSRDIPSLMREYGIDETVIKDIFFENPKQFLAY